MPVTNGSAKQYGHNIYYKMENYPGVDKAKKPFLAIKLSNKNMPGYNKIHGRCGETNMASGDHHFYFMILR